MGDVEEFSETPTGDAYLEAKYDDKSCCCMNLAYFPTFNRYLLGDWFVSLKYPILIIIAWLLSIIFLIINVFNSTELPFITRIIIVSISTFCFICLGISYFSTIAIGPGYLPFNWYNTNRVNLNFAERCKTIIQYQQQYDYAVSHPLPQRAYVSKGARRIVLRADHYCVWVETFIGIKNHRYFMLTSFWTILFSSSFLVAHIWWGKRIFTGKALITDWCTIPFALGQLVVFFFAIYHFLKAFRLLCEDTTSLEVWKLIEPYEHKKECFDSFADVCGSKWCCLCWPFPFVRLEPLESGFYRSDDGGSLKESLLSGPLYTEDRLL